MAYPFLEDLIAALTGWEIGTQFIPMFGLFVALAFFISLSVAKRSLGPMENPPIAPERLETVAFACIIVGLLGAKVFHAAEFREYGFFAQVFSRQGFSMYGGLVFGFATAVFMLRRSQNPVLRTLDVIAPVMLLGYAIGRIGCQISGDGDWGIAADMTLKPDWLPTWLWAQTYTNNIAGVTIPDPGAYPTPIYESAMAFIGFFIVNRVRVAWVNRPGFTFGIYLLIACACRFAVEFIRTNPKYGGIDLSQAQAISIVGAALGAWLVIRSRNSKPAHETKPARKSASKSKPARKSKAN